MNIQQAKEQVRKTCIAYLTKDEFGDYIVPTETQRPVFLLGAPGVGKTAIVSQVAQELGIGLVDYSMTHHTRQSAIGLPVIEKRTFGGKQFTVSEYTMSEIIAAVYNDIEVNKNAEGILFLDEINCVSETLTPAMLRFLQSKIFGGHKVPAGWVVVCAGNPPEYNRCAHTFDIATLDRLKRVEVEPDYQAWRTWAACTNTHPAVLSFLDLRPDCFYHVETKGKTQNFVTARAWSDLSTMMRLYDHHNLEIDESLAAHYLQTPAIAKEFSTYYALFATYEKKYRIQDILAGTHDAALLDTATQANFDERACVGSLLVDAMTTLAEPAVLEQRALRTVRPLLEHALHLTAQKEDAAVFLQHESERIEAELMSNALRYRDNAHARFVQNRTKALLEDIAAQLRVRTENQEACIVEVFDALLASQNKRLAQAAHAMDAGISFIARAWGEENELVLCLSAITTHPVLSDVIAEHGCDAYFAHQDLLMMDTRKMQLKKRLEELM